MPTAFLPLYSQVSAPCSPPTYDIRGWCPQPSCLCTPRFLPPVPHLLMTSGAGPHSLPASVVPGFCPPVPRLHMTSGPGPYSLPAPVLPGFCPPVPRLLMTSGAGAHSLPASVLPGSCPLFLLMTSRAGCIKVSHITWCSSLWSSIQPSLRHNLMHV